VATEDYTDYEEAKNRAQKVLKDNFLSEPPIIAEDLAKNYGLWVKHSKLKTEYHNISGFILKESSTIVINQSEPAYRKNFTIAHELGHYLLGHLDSPDYGVFYRRPIMEQDGKLEKIANCFAANLLVPEDILKKYIKDYPFATNEQLAGIFGVSTEVIGYRKKYL
jgi:Zn-dependent peptidase ImmA (M78 family)